MHLHDALASCNCLLGYHCTLIRSNTLCRLGLLTHQMPPFPELPGQLAAVDHYKHQLYMQMLLHSAMTNLTHHPIFKRQTDVVCFFILLPSSPS